MGSIGSGAPWNFPGVAQALPASHTLGLEKRGQSFEGGRAIPLVFAGTAGRRSSWRVPGKSVPRGIHCALTFTGCVVLHATAELFLPTAGQPVFKKTSARARYASGYDPFTVSQYQYCAIRIGVCSARVLSPISSCWSRLSRTVMRDSMGSALPVAGSTQFFQPQSSFVVA